MAQLSHDQKMAAAYSAFRSGLFNHKVAIVTGGGTGIGKAIAQELLCLGCKVVIAARKEERLQKAVREFYIPPDSPAQASYTKCNIRQEAEVVNLISGTISKYGRLDFVVNNAGGQFRALGEDITLKGWNAVTELNLTGTFLMCREAYKQYMKENGGAIVNILIDFTRGFPFVSHSSACRAAVDNLTKTLAVEWASAGVRINSIAPGVIYTDTSAAIYGEEAVKTNIPRIPLKRLGTSEEVSTAVCFLLSPSAAYITGETIKVDGGISLYMTQGYEVPDHTSSKPYNWKPEDEPKSKL